MHPLVEEAMKKAAVAWLTVARRPPYPVWGVWLDGALYVVSGPGEQPAPGLAGASTADVAVRGDHGGHILTWPATIGRVDPEGDEWDRVVPRLAGKRLNASGSAEDTARRWAAACVVSRLTPAAEPIAAGATLPDCWGAAAPVPTPAARRTARLFRLRRMHPG